MQSSFIQTRDLRMHYLQAGTGRPVVFLHGFPQTSYEWRHQFAALAGDYACFAPDLRGFGQTDKPGVRVSRTLLAQDIVNFMDALGIDRTDVVAHDWGGIVAFKLAIDWPERVNRLALLDTLCTVWSPGAVHGYWFKAAPYPEQFFAEFHREFIASTLGFKPGRELPERPLSPWQSRMTEGTPWADAEDLEHYTRAFADPDSHAHAISYYRYALPFHIVRDDPSGPHGERFESLSESRVAEMWNHPRGLSEHPDYAHFMDYGPEDRHKRFPNPTLWMFGTYLAKARSSSAPPKPVDWIPTGNPFSDQFTRYFPNLRARHLTAGHFFPEEAPDETNSTLADFLAGRI